MAPTILELKIPSELGNERFAMEFAADVAQELGYPMDKIENLKIAIGEACLNAIEHGNKRKKNVKVEISFVIHESRLEIGIQDRGPAFDPGSIPVPDLAAKIDGVDPRVRGWGMFLIEHLVDEMEYVSHSRGNYLKMTVWLPGQEMGEGRSEDRP